jgi:hypothetical protein
MNHGEQHHGPGPDHPHPTTFEEQVRDLLTQDAYTLRPSSVPYAAIRRQGIVERRRRLAAAGAALVVLAAAPVGAYALAGPDSGHEGTAMPASSRSSVTAPASSSPAKPSSPQGPQGPQAPATEAQFLDGVTYEQAADGLRSCIAFDKAHIPKGSPDNGLGKASDYRLLLGMRSTGDSNAPGDGIFVVAVKEGPQPYRLICNIKNGAAEGLNGSTVDVVPGAGAVVPDINGQKLYAQSFMDKGNWRLPFRWGSIGTVDPSVARVTVTYGGRTSEAVLDDGWFVATGELTEQVTKAPRIKGYDTNDKLVYDSDDDRGYMQQLP